ncbi:MAG: LCP family protein, partial [Candidatus Paceibacteria bacterium]
MSNQRNARSMSSQPRGRKTRTQKSPSLGKRILKGGLILGAVSLVIGGGVAAFVFQNVHSTMNTVTEQEASIGDTFQTILPGNDSPITATQGRTNMLILGMRGLQDQHGGILTDSIMIMSIDRSDKTATLISLPRDLYVKVPGYQGKYKLN